MFHNQTCIYRPPCCYSTTWWVLYVHIFWPAYNDHQSTKNVLCLLTSGLCSQAWLRYWVKMFNKEMHKWICKMIQLLSLYRRMYYWLWHFWLVCHKYCRFSKKRLMNNYYIQTQNYVTLLIHYMTIYIYTMKDTNEPPSYFGSIIFLVGQQVIAIE